MSLRSCRPRARAGVEASRGNQGRYGRGRISMLKLRALLAIATATILGAGVVTGCNGNQSAAAGEVIDPAEAAKTVVLHVNNLNDVSMELRVIQNGHSDFVGSVGGSDSTSILLDPSLFPTGTLYVAPTPADGRGRVVLGPLMA